MTRFDKYKYHGLRTTRTIVKDGEDVTRQGLAYTPADMARMTAQGIPVTSKEIASRFYDGDDHSDFHVSSDRVKGNDVNDLWEADKTLRQKAKNAYIESKKHKSE